MPAALQAAEFLARPGVFLERNWHQYGDVFSLRIKGFGTGRHVVLADPAMIEQVFKGSPTDLRLGEVADKFLTPITGPSSLLVLDGDEHLAHRRLILPPFHGERMLAYAGIMAEATDRSIERWPLDEPFALRPRMADITMEVVMRTVFGVEQGHRYQELSAALLTLLGNTNVANVLSLAFPRLRRDFGPIRTWSNFQRDKARVDTLLNAEIARRRQSDLDDREDILSMLLLANRRDGAKLSDDELHDELITMLLAGHETTASALAWTFDLLLHHPEVLATLQDSLRRGDDSYLEATVQEALRLRPVVATSQRILHAPMAVGDHELPSGITILAGIWLVHRRPDIYPDPLAFRPERFLNKRPGTYTWIPFGGGVRRCIGANFAPMEMKVVLRQVLTQVNLTAASPKLERPVNRVVLLAPRHGTMAIRRR
ncbi:cytochrome P450 [Paraconexibacter antarcticus]|uniref:Cytochrome P450 n=1 Tax=Paraconexibacter antarcticus TaxID=2949664 RepID=A0ABY5E0Q4_9ACTN|nr:cytochrome P450 [Paraconexibacter antarcticus]UTI66737.1 cytochrome P450 [Paraconexibacter antarcticus]